MEKYYSTLLYKPWWKRRIGKIVLIFFSIIILFLFYFAFLVYQEVKNIEFGGGTLLDPNAAALLKKEPLDQETSRRIVESKDDPFLGPEDAKAVIVEFADFECPYSEKSFSEVRGLMAKYQDRVKFVFRDFPLTTIHASAQIAAEASECAHEQGRFWEMHDKIFLSQRDLSKKSLETIATQIGLDMEQFQACFDTHKKSQEVEEDFKAGVEARVAGTPTFFFNGIPWFGAMDGKQFELIIEKLLETTKE